MHSEAISSSPSSSNFRSMSSASSRSRLWSTGLFRQATMAPLRSFSRENSSRDPSRLTRKRRGFSGSSNVVNLRSQLMHSRRRRIARPSRATLESSTFCSSKPQYGQIKSTPRNTTSCIATVYTAQDRGMPHFFLQHFCPGFPDVIRPLSDSFPQDLHSRQV